MYKHGGDIYSHENILDFSANINPLGTPPAVLEAACNGVKEAARYPDPLCRELIQAIGCREKVKTDEIICGNGAAELIFSLCLALKPKKALLLAPTFHEYQQALQSVDCGIRYHDLKESQGFHLQPAFLDALTDDLDIVFLCNPNNPTGILTENSLLLKILERCREKGIFLVLDECFNDFLDAAEAHTMKEKRKDFPNLFILKAFTKIYAMAGLRLGYGLTANKELLHKMKCCTQPWSVSIPAQKAGIAALQEKEYVKTALALIKEERAYLRTALKEAEFTVYDSAANYLFFQGPPSLYDRCLQKQILIRDCGNYQGLRRGFYRVVVREHGDNKKLIAALKTE